MSTFTPKRLGQAQAATGSYGTIYTVPASTTAVIKEVVICNTTSGAVTLDLSFVPSGGTAGAANAIFSTLSVSANETKIYSMSSVLAAAGTVQAKASAGTSLTLTVSGIEVV